MWRTLLVTACPRRGIDAPSEAQAAEAARVARTAPLAGALAGEVAGTPAAVARVEVDWALAAALAPPAASARQIAMEVDFTARAPFDVMLAVCTEVAPREPRQAAGQPARDAGRSPIRERPDRMPGPYGKPVVATHGAIVEFRHRVFDDADGECHDGT